MSALTTAASRRTPTATFEEIALRRKVKRDRLLAWTLPVLFFALVIILWQVAVDSGNVNPIIVPSPVEVSRALWEMSQETFFWQALKVTMIETLAGFAIGVGGAWVLGTLIGTFSWVRYSLYPAAVALQIAPRVALAPLFLVWFGFGLTSKVVMAATICFFPVLINVVVGLQTVDREAVTFLKSLGASRWQQYRLLGLPSSLPLIFASLKTAVTLALLGAIVGEFAGGSEGMGILVKTFNSQLEVAEGFAVIVALMIVGLLLYAVMELVENRIVFWKGRS
jgi:NitT/TauT family transport system permease protein